MRLKRGRGKDKIKWLLLHRRLFPLLLLIFLHPPLFHPLLFLPPLFLLFLLLFMPQLILFFYLFLLLFIHLLCFLFSSFYLHLFIIIFFFPTCTSPFFYSLSFSYFSSSCESQKKSCDLTTEVSMGIAAKISFQNKRISLLILVILLPPLPSVSSSSNLMSHRKS